MKINFERKPLAFKLDPIYYIPYAYKNMDLKTLRIYKLESISRVSVVCIGFT